MGNKSQWITGDNNLERLDKSLNKVEGVLRAVYTRKPYLYLYKVNSGNMGIHLIRDESCHELNRICIRASRATSIELADVKEICLKIPMQECFYEKMKNIDHLVFISNKKRRFDGEFEIIIIDGKKLRDMLFIMHNSTPESLQQKGYKILKGYLILALDWCRQSGMLLGHYLMHDELNKYTDLETGKIYKQIDKARLRWHRFKLIPFDGEERKKSIVVLNTETLKLMFFDSSRDACKEYQVTKQNLSYHLLGKSKYFKVQGVKHVAVFDSLDTDTNDRLLSERLYKVTGGESEKV